MGFEGESNVMAEQIKAAEMDALRARYRNGSTQERSAIKASLGPVEIEFADIKMVVNPRDNYTETRMWLDGCPPELKSLMAVVDLVEDRNVLVMDIGANCGAFTIPLALACGEGSRVIAFEPNPIMVDRLGVNIQLNNLTDVIAIEACALSDRAGEATLNFRGHNYGQASLKDVEPGMRNGTIKVPTRPLSHFSAASKTHDFTLLKIDVEGAEETVLGPVLKAGQSGGWLPDAILVEVRHADEWQGDLCAEILASGFTEQMQAEGNALYLKSK
ncbi:methyltransferase, FkbM family [Sulfitobacter marinus]|uniref:Methyltransferase, FkbM family n=2 Tax=Sulfitobacter marinus TaxID=394264 RepID=A0A1I6U963_9RHOB|nr:methyltransferase, FkbM family [Sulfitobacter marinus]